MSTFKQLTESSNSITVFMNILGTLIKLHVMPSDYPDRDGVIGTIIFGELNDSNYRTDYIKDEELVKPFLSQYAQLDSKLKQAETSGNDKEYSSIENEISDFHRDFQKACTNRIISELNECKITT